ncbi:transglycosylase domain-containing protein [Paenisporosarcina sp. NPDC076898]|uniref:transglycosylase domain-containing protein n=1 Tax=unclassified Paenisporosarcina TaxID=2642018 RepID=UPI003CFE7B56
MNDQVKNWLKKIDETWIRLTNTKWAKGLRITSGVIWNLALILLIVLLVGGAFAGSVGAGYFASLVDQEPLREEAELRSSIFSYEETSEVYFANNVYLGKLRTDLQRRETKLKEVSPYVLDAVYATEDEYFKVHDGIVPKAIFRGLLQDVTNSDSQTGGSTLTQQLIKNQILTNEVSYERKAKEILLAMRLEKFMEKDEILEAYLNIIPYGRNAAGANIAGIETAAEGIFNVKAKDLNLPQAAFIAGIPQAPFAHTPFTSDGLLKDEDGLKPGIDRMLTVLYRMKETGYITEQEYNGAIAYDIKKDFRSPELLPQERYPFLTYELERQAKQIIAELLAEKDGIDPTRLIDEEKLNEKYTIMADRSMRNNGYRIHSTIDKKMYDAHQKVKDEFKNYGPSIKVEKYNAELQKNEWVEEPVQVGSVLMENSTGKILSFIGGRSYDIEASNHATQRYRQNGSTMKPLLIYGPAIEYGLIGAGSPVVDVAFKDYVDGTGKPYSPRNFTKDQELGIIPARQALASSQNLAALRLYNQIVEKRPAEFLKKIGFSRLIEEDYVNLSASIGGIRNGVTIEENTTAYATLANGGQMIDSYMIEKIEDADGKIIFQHKSEAVPVYSPQTSYIVTDMLRDVLSEGTGRRAQSELKFKSDFAAKTGTTNNAHDVWFMGYNPSITLGVWLGYDTPTNLNISNGTYLQPGTRVNMLWAKLMNSSYEVNAELIDPATEFKAPKGVVSQSFCAISGMTPSEECSRAGLVKSDLFNANTYVPSKADDSFVSSSYVMIGGKRFRALPTTPSEFVVSGGVGVNKDFIDRMFGNIKGEASKLFPQDSSFANRVVSEDTFEADGASPGSVSASLSGSTLSWSKSPSNDVVGYRVFRSSGGGNELLSSVKEASGNSYQVNSPGTYFVVAVDITGQQSPASNMTVVEAPKAEPTPEPKPTPTPEPKPGTEPKPKPKPEPKPDPKPEPKPEPPPEEPPGDGEGE